MTIIHKFRAAYQQQLTRRPLFTQSATAAALYAIGDTIAQNLSSSSSQDEEIASKKFDWYRTAQMTAIGGWALGPSMAIWCRYSQNRIKLSSKLASTIARVAADQLIFAPVSIVGLFFLVQFTKPTANDLQKRLELAQQQVKSTFGDVLVQNYKLWPAVQMVNFTFVPLQYRLLVSNTVAVFWSAYLSMNANERAPRGARLLNAQ